MSDNKWLSDMLSKVDERVLKTKLNKAMDLLKNGSDEEIKKALDKVDKEEVMEKIDTLDKKSLTDNKINFDDLKKKVTDEDLEKISTLAGSEGDKLVKKIKELLK